MFPVLCACGKCLGLCGCSTRFLRMRAFPYLFPRFSRPGVPSGCPGAPGGCPFGCPGSQRTRSRRMRVFLRIPIIFRGLRVPSGVSSSSWKAPFWLPEDPKGAPVRLRGGLLWRPGDPTGATAPLKAARRHQTLSLCTKTGRQPRPKGALLGIPRARHDPILGSGSPSGGPEASPGTKHQTSQGVGGSGEAT